MDEKHLMRFQSGNAIFKCLRRCENGLSEVKEIFECITKLPPVREPIRIRVLLNFSPQVILKNSLSQKCFNFTEECNSELLELSCNSLVIL